MRAFITDQGTAIADAMICDSCSQDENNVMTVMSFAADERDWNQGDLVDCSGNDLAECAICGAKNKTRIWVDLASGTYGDPETLVVVDLDNETVEAMDNGQMSDSEIWRAAIEAAESELE